MPANIVTVEDFELFTETPSYGGIMAEELFRDFFVAAQMGAPAPAPIEDSVHLLEIIEAAKESSATGRAIHI